MLSFSIFKYESIFWKIYIFIIWWIAKKMRKYMNSIWLKIFIIINNIFNHRNALRKTEKNHPEIEAITISIRSVCYFWTPAGVVLLQPCLIPSFSVLFSGYDTIEIPGRECEMWYLHCTLQRPAGGPERNLITPNGVPRGNRCLGVLTRKITPSLSTQNKHCNVPYTLHSCI